MAEVINRYGRQELIEGWNQDKIKKAKIAIIGAGHVGNFLASSLGALGVGDLRIYDDSRAFYQEDCKKYCDREFLTSNLGRGRSKVEALEKKVQKINPLIDVYGLQMELDNVSAKIFDKPDLLISCVNDFVKIGNYYEFASENEIPMYIVQADEKGGFFTRSYSDIRDYSNKDQEGIVSEVIAGLLSGEVLKKIMGKDALDKLAYYPGKNRFNLNGVVDKINIERADLKKKKVLVVGAGALGNFLGIGLSHANIGKMYLVDDDIIETTNLNRQILFYDKVGDDKAKALAERLNEINPDISIEPIKKRVDEYFEESIEKIKPDLLIDCVDNLATRAILNHFALRYNIPLISGGTDYKAGQVVAFEPGKSSCLDCRLGADKALVEARTSSSCIHAPTPSVVITNHIIGGLMAAEARCILESKNYGEAVKKTIKYDSTKSNRVGLIGSEEKCDCKRKISAESWIKKLIPDKQ